MIYLVVVANLTRGYTALAEGCRVYFTVLGSPASKHASLKVIAKSRGGRWIATWVRCSTLGDVRVAPTHLEDAVLRHDTNEALMRFDDKKTAQEMVDMIKSGVV